MFVHRVFGLILCHYFVQSAGSVELSLQQKFMEDFRSARIEFLKADSEFARETPGRWGFSFPSFLLDSIGEVPRGQKDPRLADCLQRVGGGSLQSLDLKVLNRAVEKTLVECETSIETGRDTLWYHLLKLRLLNANLFENRFYHRVLFHLPEGQKLKGLLALKGDLKKRPLILFRAGVFGSVEELIPEKFIPLILFEQSPFNLLILESTTSPDFVHFNQQRVVGGFDESLQNLFIARLLQDPKEPLSQLVSSLHMLGVSLGGHGALFTSWLEQYNRGAESQAIFQSYLGFCPVMNLKPTIEALTPNTWKGVFFDMWIWKRLRSLSLKEPSLGSFPIWSWLNKKPFFLREVANLAESRFDPNKVRAWDVLLPPALLNKKSFFEANDFWKDYSSSRPFWVWATPQDDLVPYRLNAGSFLQSRPPNIQVLTWSRGFHCTFPFGNNWHFLSQTMIDYFLNRSPEFKQSSRDHRINLSTHYSREARLWRIQSIQWKVEAAKSLVDVKIENFKDPGQSFFVLLPVENFDFRVRDRSLSVQEKQMIERWLYHNLFFENRKGPNGLELWMTWKVAEID